MRGTRQEWPRELALVGTTTLLLTLKAELARAALGWPASLLGTLCAASFALVVASLISLLPGVVRGAALAVVLLLASASAQADLCYVRRFGDVTSVAHLAFADQLVAVTGSVAELLRPRDLLLWWDVPVAVFMLRRPRTEGRWKLGLAGATGGLALLAITLAWPLEGARQRGLTGVHLADAVREASRPWRRAGRVDRARASAAAWLTHHRPRSGTLNLHGRNVIVVQVESLQAFVLGLRTDGGAVAPALDALARESLSFQRFFEQTGQGTTADADLLAQCSLYPLRQGAAYFRYSENTFACLPSLLRTSGYSTLAMQGIEPGFWNLDVIYPRIGIERYLSLSDVPSSRRSITGLGLRDDRLLDWAADELEGSREPSYTFVVTLTSHDPFDVSWIPSPLDVGTLEGTKAGRYLQAIHWTDDAIGRFVERLRSSGLLDESILVVYGDHAGLFRSDSGADLLMPHEARTESGWNVFERRVPLLIRLPHGGSAGTRQLPGGQIDIAPTLAALLGIDASAAPWLGRNLLDGTTAGTVFFHDGSALSEDLLFISDKVARAAPGCFDSATGDHLPREACRALAADAELALGVSRDILELDLVPALQSP